MSPFHHSDPSYCQKVLLWHFPQTQTHGSVFYLRHIVQEINFLKDTSEALPTDHCALMTHVRGIYMFFYRCAVAGNLCGLTSSFLMTQVLLKHVPNSDIPCMVVNGSWLPLLFSMLNFDRCLIKHAAQNFDLVIF